MSMRILILSLALLALGFAPTPARAEARWQFGFGRSEILPDPDSEEPLYIAGYHNGWEISGVLDYCEARAVWLDAGGEGVLLIGVDCVGLDSGSIAVIQKALSDLPGCAAVNVYATHTHAGPDTLGLWAPVGADGKNSAYMQALYKAAEAAGRDAYASRRSGALYYGKVTTEGMYRDSRLPIVTQPDLYQLRFADLDGGKGLRLLFYGAHAESLRGDNTLLSRDYPGLLCDGVSEATGDDAMFFPGAIGGLVMTREFVSDTTAQAEENLRITADRLIEYALSIGPEAERPLAPELAFVREDFTVPLDNTVFLFYKSLGILNHKSVPAENVTGLAVETSLSLLRLGGVTIALIPGEIFPELVYGGACGDANPKGENPPPLNEIAARHGLEELLIVGLANDELGYIVPPSDFLLNRYHPYIERTMDAKGEDHYEETNSVGPECAAAIAKAFETAAERLR